MSCSDSQKGDDPGRNPYVTLNAQQSDPQHPPNHDKPRHAVQIRPGPFHRNRLRRPGRRQPSQGPGQGRHRTADRRQPVCQHRQRHEARHQGDQATIRRTTARRWGCPSSARPSPPTITRNTASTSRAENVVVGPGAKVFEQFFCEAFLDPGDAVLVFSPHFPTYAPNIERRGARMVVSPLKQENAFRPEPQRRRELRQERRRGPRRSSSTRRTIRPAASPPKTTCKAIADLIRGKNIAVFSDEPYNHMVWTGKHHPLLAQPGILDQVVACYTFSKSYSMSGWRLGYAVSSPRIVDAIGKMINTSLSCVPPDRAAGRRGGPRARRPPSATR